MSSVQSLSSYFALTFTTAVVKLFGNCSGSDSKFNDSLSLSSLFVLSSLSLSMHGLQGKDRKEKKKKKKKNANLYRRKDRQRSCCPCDPLLGHELFEESERMSKE